MSIVLNSTVCICRYIHNAASLWRRRPVIKESAASESDRITHVTYASCLYLTDAGDHRRNARQPHDQNTTRLPSCARVRRNPTVCVVAQVHRLLQLGCCNLPGGLRTAGQIYKGYSFRDYLRRPSPWSCSWLQLVGWMSFGGLTTRVIDLPSDWLIDYSPVPIEAKFPKRLDDNVNSRPVQADTASEC